MNAEENDELEVRWYKLLFQVLLSIRYHKYRERFYERFHKFVIFSAVFSGAASVTSMVSDLSPIFQTIPPVLVSFFAICELVMNCNGMMRRHNEFVHEYSELEGRLRTEEKTKELLDSVNRKILKIENSEPKSLSVLNIICYNEVILAEGRQDEEGVDYYEIPWWKRLPSQWFDVSPDDIRPYEKHTGNPEAA